MHRHTHTHHTSHISLCWQMQCGKKNKRFWVKHLTNKIIFQWMRLEQAEIGTHICLWKLHVERSSRALHFWCESIISTVDWSLNDAWYVGGGFSVGSVWSESSCIRTTHVALYWQECKDEKKRSGNRTNAHKHINTWVHIYTFKVNKRKTKAKSEWKRKS